MKFTHLPLDHRWPKHKPQQICFKVPLLVCKTAVVQMGTPGSTFTLKTTIPTMLPLRFMGEEMQSICMVPSCLLFKRLEESPWINLAWFRLTALYNPLRLITFNYKTFYYCLRLITFIYRILHSNLNTWAMESTCSTGFYYQVNVFRIAVLKYTIRFHAHRWKYAWWAERPRVLPDIVGL